MPYKAQCEPAPTSLPLGPLCSSHAPWNDLPPACQLVGSFYLFRLKCHLYREVSLDCLNLIPSPAVPPPPVTLCYITLFHGTITIFFSYVLFPPLERKLHKVRDVCLFNSSGRCLVHFKLE